MRTGLNGLMKIMRLSIAGTIAATAFTASLAGPTPFTQLDKAPNGAVRSVAVELQDSMRFDAAGKLGVACLVQGHSEAGMTGSITVAP